MSLFRAGRIAFALLSISMVSLATMAADPDPFDFSDVTRDAKPWTRWWWLGSAVDEKNLTRSLEEFAAAGLGGVEITPIYGVKGQEHRHIDYLTPKWLRMLAHTATEARRLDLGVDMPTGTGWPFGGPTVALEDADMKVTIKEADLARTGDSVGVPDDGVLLSLMAYPEDGAPVDLTAQVRDGVVTGALPTSPMTYYVVYYRFSGRTVKRPAPGGAGYTVNTYSEGALRRYLDQFGEKMDGYTGPPLRAHFHDSFEYTGNWMPDLWSAFEKQHGYDLRHHLPAMMGHGDPDRVARIKADYRATLAQRLLDAFTAQWTDWAHAQGALTRNQAHGSPGNLIDLYARVDIPETEIFGPSGFPIPGLRTDDYFNNEPPDLLMLKFASSAAHLTGKPLVSSETFTWLGEHFQVALSQAKPEVDQLLAAGINHIFYHGTPYSPDDAAWPGWLFYASVHFGPTNPWWDDFRYLNGYIGRCQALLQASKPDNDVLLYFPLHDIWHDPDGLMKQLTVHNIDDWLVDTPFYNAAEALTEHGYAFDYVSDAILQSASVKNGRITLPGGAYDVVVIPETPRMSPGTLERLLILADGGARVVFLGDVPSQVPGYNRLEKRREAMKRLNNAWARARAKHTGTSGTAYGSGHIHERAPLVETLAALDVVVEPLATSGLAMIRRKHDAGRLYFVANLTAESVDAYWPLGTPAASVVWLDPLHQTSGRAQTRAAQDGTTAVRIALKPGESCFLRTYTDERVAGSAWPYWAPAGPATAIDGPWEVSFVEGGPELPAPYTMDTLASWTEAPDDEAKRFAGTARYETTFDAPDGDAAAWRLDLGRVCESARVTLNGQFLGAAWALPSELMVTEPLKPTGNRLVVEATNLAANRIADMDRREVEWKIFHDANIVNIRYERFDASDWPLMDSGLLGPVNLVPLQRQTVRQP